MRTFKTPKGTELPLMDIKGKDYLRAAPRILWLREEHPDWSIETEFLQLSEKSAVCKATIRDGQGKILAQGTSMETLSGFESFVEKSETCAISRAASFCGYGTLMAQELEEQGKLAESPIDKKPGSDQSAKATGNEQNGTIAPHHFESEPQHAHQLSQNDPGAFVMPFGKFKGKTLGQMGKPGVKSWKEGIEKQLQEKNQKPTGQMPTVLAEAERFLND